MTADPGAHRVPEQRHAERFRPVAPLRATIEQAKGMLMMRYGVPEDRAFELLRRWSMRNNVTPAALAALLVHASTDVDDTSTHDDLPGALLDRGLARWSWLSPAHPCVT